jgi:hypothetical protein
MKKFIVGLFVSSLMVGAPPAVAQQGGFAPDPATQAKFKAYQPVFDLVGRVSLMTELDAQKGLTFTKAQAKTLVPVLKDLQTRADLKPKDATAILTKIEDKILTEKQLVWLDDTQLKREEERRKNFQNGGGQPGGSGGPGAGGNGGPGGGPGGGRGGMFKAIQDGTPFNPFKDDRMGKPLADLIALLSKR